MDIVQHAAHGYLMVRLIEAGTGTVLPLPLEAGSALVGALPDLIGMYGTLILKDDWRLYTHAHEPYRFVQVVQRSFKNGVRSDMTVNEVPAHKATIAWWLRWLPPYGLHLFLDKHTHGTGKRWWVWRERLWLEIVGWIVTAGVWWWCGYSF